MAERDCFSASRQRPGAFISAPDDAPGIRKTIPPPRRWHPTNISPTGSSKVPVLRRSAATISSCMSGIARIVPPGMSAKTRSNISENWTRRRSSNRLQGSRGDFAQVVHGEAALERYLLAVSQHYDSVLIQPIVTGHEYRIFLLDDEIAYSVRKYPPFVSGRWRALHPRSPDRAQRGLASARPFTGRRNGDRRHLRSTSCCPPANAGRFPGG